MQSESIDMFPQIGIRIKKNKMFLLNVKILLFYRIINVYVLFTAMEENICG